VYPRTCVVLCRPVDVGHGPNSLSCGFERPAVRTEHGYQGPEADDGPAQGPEAVDLDRADARVGSLAEVRSVDVTRAWPDGVRIEVVERTAVAVVDISGRLRGLDADGVVFREYRTAPKGMPRVRPGAAAGTDALKEAATVVSALPQDLASRIDHVEVATVDQITLVMRDRRRVMWGSAEESALKAQVVDRLLAAQEASVYDVSVPGNPTIR